MTQTRTIIVVCGALALCGAVSMIWLLEMKPAADSESSSLNSGAGVIQAEEAPAPFEMPASHENAGPASALGPASLTSSTGGSKEASNTNVRINGRVLYEDGTGAALVDVLYSTDSSALINALGTWLARDAGMNPVGASGVLHTNTDMNGDFECSFGSTVQPTQLQRGVIVATFSDTASVVLSRINLHPIDTTHISLTLKDDRKDIVGRTVDGVTKPVAGVTIRAVGEHLHDSCGHVTPPDDKNLLRKLSALNSTVSMADGTFALRGLCSTSYTLTLAHDNYSRTTIAHSCDNAARECDVGSVSLDSGAHIGGLIVDSQGLPVPGAEVVVYSGNSMALEWEDSSGVRRRGQTQGGAIADTMGAFYISGLAEEAFYLTAVAPSFARSQPAVIQCNTANNIVTLTRGGTAILAVVDNDTSHAIANANISVANQAGTAPAVSSTWQMQSRHIEGAPGSYEITQVGTQGARCLVHATGYARSSVSIPSLETGQVWEASVRLRPEVTLGGMVIDTSGDLVRGAVVQVSPAEDDLRDLGTLHGVSSDLGKFALSGLVSGLWQIWVTADGYLATNTSEVVIEGSHDNHLTITLVPAGGIRGTISTGISHSGKESSIIEVVALPLKARDSSKGESEQFLAPVGARAIYRAMVDVGQSPTFMFTGLHAGKYLVSAGLPGDDSVTDSAARQYVAQSVNGEQPTGIGEVTDDGSIAVVDVVPSSVTSIDLVLTPFSSVRGHIVIGGAASTDATVAILRKTGEEWRLAASVQVDYTGDYHIDDIEPGEIAVVALINSIAIPPAREIFLHRNDIAVVDFSVSGQRVRCKVVDSNGRGVNEAGLRIFLHPQMGASEGPPGTLYSLGGSALGAVARVLQQAGSSLEHTTDADGRAVFDQVPPGIYNVIASGQEWLRGPPAIVTISDTWQPEDVVVVVSRSASIRGSVAGANSGLTPTGLVVEVYREKSAGVVSWVTVDSGNYYISGLTEGEYLVELVHQSGNRETLAKRNIVVRAGQETRVNFSL